MKPTHHRGIFIAIAVLLVGGCGDGEGSEIIVVPGPTPTPTPSPTPAPTPTPAPGQVSIAFTFQQTVQGWQAVFADYSADLASNYEFRSGYATVPPNLTNRSGFLLSSSNRSDDVFMGAYRLVDQLQPNTAYRVDATITFASNEGTGCPGIGGSSGQSVYVKVGASSVLPEPSRTGYVRLPLDKGEQATSGRDMVVIGDVATAENAGCDSSRNPYLAKTLTTATRSPIVRSDAIGRLWLVMGTDSGYEGRTTIYLLEGSYTLSPA